MTLMDFGIISMSQGTGSFLYSRKLSSLIDIFHPNESTQTYLDKKDVNKDIFAYPASSTGEQLHNTPRKENRKGTRSRVFIRQNIF
jgi:hypothetical protein